MIESLIEILEQTPASGFCNLKSKCQGVDCEVCPFLCNTSKENLITELKEFVDANE